MMKAASANRMTKMKVIENGTIVKTVANASINYGQDLQQLKKMIEIAIRLSPQDPVYVVDKICIEIGDGKYGEVNQEELVQIQNTLFKAESAAASLGSKVSLKVYVTRPAGLPNRSVSRIRERENRDTQGANNENSKYENIMRPPSPMHMRRANTPSKARAQSRGRFIAASPRAPATPVPAAATPSAAQLPRGASPMRVPRPSTIAPPTESLSTAPIPAAPSSVVAATSNPPAQSSRVPFAAANPMASDLDVSVHIDDCMPPPSAAKSGRKPRRLTQMDIEEEERRKILHSINQTWTEVEGANEAPDTEGSPAKSFLAPFQYYSPLDKTRGDDDCSQLHDDEDFQSCAGDMGDPDAHTNVREEVPSEEIHPAPDAPIAPQAGPSATPSSDHAPPCTPPTTSKAPFSPDRPLASSSTTTTTPKRTSIIGKLFPGSTSKKSSSVSANGSNAHAQTSASTPAKPVYPDGRTCGESAASYDQSLRNYRNPKGAPGNKKKPTPANTKTTANDLSPLGFRKSTTRDAEGRPSIGTITTQWEFMRTAFVNNSDEELEWLMISKKAGAYHYAHKKHQSAEDKYFKSLYEIDFFQVQVKLFGGPQAKLPSMFQELGGKYSVLMANPKDEAAGEAVLQLQKRIKEHLEQQPGGSKAVLVAFSNKVEQQLTALLAEEDKFRIVRKARDFAPLFASEAAQLQHKYTAAVKDSETSLENMEKWAKRELETEEYPRVMREQEEEWMRREYEDNLQALHTMRSYFPENIFDATIPEIQQLVKERHGLISLELAQELKQNKLLHWLVTHPDEIATSSFLTGDRKAYFENLEGLDLTEMRALALVLPLKFELDNDGRKAEWRQRFMNRLKQLVTQWRGESVKGPWDASKNARTMVELPPLKPEQVRRSVYYFRTKEVSDVKLKQFDDKLNLLRKKKEAFAKAEQEFKDAKEEYDTVLKEMRDPDFVDQYGLEKLASVKDMAKTEYVQAEKRKKVLDTEVARLKKSIEEAPLTREQFVELEAELCAFLTERGVPWAEKGTPAELIFGVFPGDRVIEKRVQAAAKFVTAEQEAMERKMELSALKARPAAGEAVSAGLASTSLDASSSSSAAAAAAAAEGGNREECGRASTPTEGILDSSALLLLSGEEVPSTPCDAMAGGGEAARANGSISGVTPHPFQTPRSERKQSILLTANSDMLNTLNKMFSNMASPAGKAPIRTRTPSRRMSVASLPLSSNGVAAEESNEGPKVVKQSKSKLLMRLLGGGKDEKAGRATTPPRQALSFLDQLKARAGGSSNDDGKPAAPKLSFLDQLKARAGVQSGEDVDCGLKARVAPPMPPAAACAAEAGALPVPPPARPAMSFLDQIKAHRKE